MTNNGNTGKSVKNNLETTVGSLITWLEYNQEKMEPAVTGFNCKMGVKGASDTLIIWKGEEADGTPVVAFTSGDEILTALSKGIRKIMDGSLKWRVDEWRMQNG